MKKSRTNRGFSLIEFKDRYGESCSLQQSSLAEENCLWLGCDKAYYHPVFKTPLSPRMHLTQEMVAELIKELSYWLETGELNVAAEEK